MHLTMPVLFLPRLSATLVTLLPIIVHGHGYLKTPRSRNYVAYMDGVSWGGTELTPEVEYNYMSADRKAATATCGVIDGIRNYDYPKNAIGGALAPKSQACYQPGQIIDLEVTLTAHHKGHFEFKMCPIVPFEAPTQACFDANPLTFVTDTKYGATFDPNYPERAYIPDAEAGNTFSYKYKLPDGVSGDLVLLQWHYVTANSCIPEGYYGYNWPVGTYWSGPNPLNMATCGPLPLDGEWGGKIAPEQFWNCAEIKVANNCTGVPSLPPVTSKPTLIPTLPMPTITPTQKPTSPPTETPTYAPVAPSPPVTSKPTSSMPTGNNSPGYCNWGPAGTAASSTCNLEVQGGDWCNTNKEQCEAGCSGKWCTNMMSAPTTKAPAVVTITKKPTKKPTNKPLAPTKRPTRKPTMKSLAPTKKPTGIFT